jgi:hypothetical protein
LEQCEFPADFLESLVSSPLLDLHTRTVNLEGE